MSVVDSLFWVVSLVLVTAGASKLVEPAPVASTLAALGSRSTGSGRKPGDAGASILLARAVGVVEVAVGLAALIVGGPVLAAAVAVAYGTFAVVVVMARRRGLPSCGCFGVSSAPPSWVHVAVNVVSAGVAATAAVAGGGPVPVADGLSALGGTGFVVAGLVLLATVLVVVVDTTVADVVEATRVLAEQAGTEQAGTEQAGVGQAGVGQAGVGQAGVGQGAGDRMGATA